MKRALPFRIGLIVPALLAAAFALGSFKLGFWVDGVPGPGVLPLVAAILLLLVIAVAWIGGPQDDDEQTYAPVAGVALLVILVYAGAAPYGGMVLATFALIAVWVRYLHAQTWLRAVAVAAGLVAANVLLFGFLLKVQLPLGPGL